MKLIVSLSLLVALGVPSLRAAEVASGPIGEIQMLKRYAWDRLDSAANLLRVVIDAETGETGLKEFCGLRSSDAKALVLPLHALIDAKIAQDAKDKRAWQGSKLAQAKLCEVDCHCGLVADALVDPKFAAVRESARVKAAKLSPAVAQACARRNVSWFCGSDLLKYLRLSAKDLPPIE